MYLEAQAFSPALVAQIHLLVLVGTGLELEVAVDLKVD